MMDLPSTLGPRLQDLRRSFDQSFAQLPQPAQSDVERMVFFRVGGNPYALRLSEISALVPVEGFVGLPSPVRELRGLTSVYGRLLPVYDLGILLDASNSESKLRWAVRITKQHSVALGFEEFETLAGVPRSRIDTVESGASEGIHQVVRLDSSPRWIASGAWLMSAIEQKNKKLDVGRT